MGWQLNISLAFLALVFALIALAIPIITYIRLQAFHREWRKQLDEQNAELLKEYEIMWVVSNG